MDMVDVISTSHFTDTRIGGVSRKQRLRLPILLAEELQSIGLVNIMDPQPTTAKNNRPTEALAAGGGKSSASLPADQASPKKTAKLLEEPIVEPSQSMTLGEEPDSQTSSMLATDSGGTTITEKSPKNSKASSGRKTNTRQSATKSTA